MPTVNFIDKFGVESRVDCEVGATLMTAAKRAGIKGIEAECGGTLSCATCHVYVEEGIALAKEHAGEVIRIRNRVRVGFW